MPTDPDPRPISRLTASRRYSERPAPRPALTTSARMKDTCARSRRGHAGSAAEACAGIAIAAVHSRTSPTSVIVFFIEYAPCANTFRVEDSLLRDANNRETDRYSGSWAALWWLLALAYPVVLIVAANRPEFGAEFTRMLVRKLLPGLASRHVHTLVVAIRKSGHFLGYSLFATILANAFLSFSRPPRNRRTLAIACLAAAIAAVGVASMDEYIQVSAAFRSGSRQDVLVDSLGVLTALIIRIGRAE